MDAKGKIYGLKCKCSEDCAGVIRYVGQTTTTDAHRLRRHVSRSNKLPVGDWVHRHGSKHIEMVTLESDIPVPKLDDREVHWISEKRTFMAENQGGLNLTRGGSRPRDPEEVDLLRKRNPIRGTLEWGDVSEIRRLHSSTDMQTVEIASRFGVSASAVNDVIRNKTWVDPEYEFRPRQRGDSSHFDTAKLTPEIAAEIRRQDPDHKGLAEKYGVSPASIRRVYRNETWYDPGYTPKPDKENSGLEKARQMREEYAKGYLTYADIAEKYGMTRSSTADILTNRTFKEKNK